jgi:CheY-like chemotaxis protein
MKSPHSISAFINEAIQLALGDSIVKSRLYVAEDIWPIDCEPDQIRHMITKLASNVNKLIPEGGTVEIEAINQFIGADEIPPLKAGRYVRLSIKDHGTGVLGEYLPTIFDPYFSTQAKGTDKVVGLGISWIYSIARKTPGQIGIDSKTGHGRVFHIYLPALGKMPETDTAEETRSAAFKGRVLLMDDEDMIRDMASQMLNHMGYEVELVRSGAEAIERYKESRRKGNPFDIVILDLTIRGGWGGEETIKGLIEIDPTVKAILSSGETAHPAVSYFREYGFSALLPKPYSMRELSKTLQKVLLSRKA